ncbi:probable amidase At4g34880 [Manihot esculenta]|uniref:probable amidase At4g34880 n=1 Tax=Manihot esculenta TaxID=3983 RepID=UPI000B5D41CF|nr:probable amidase At4g34880 [Manihot esculenta]
MKSNVGFKKAMCDLGVSINVMPLSIYNSLNDGPFKKTSVIIQLANRYIIYPDGVLEDNLVQVDGDVTNGDSIDVLDTLNQNTFELSHDDKLNQQELLEEADSMEGADKKLKVAVENLNKLSRNGLEKLVREHNIDALVAPYDMERSSSISTVFAIGGYPGITVPAGYDTTGLPFGICFGGLKGTEPKLIEIVYGFEQATKKRKPPVIQATSL